MSALRKSVEDILASLPERHIYSNADRAMDYVKEMEEAGEGDIAIENKLALLIAVRDELPPDSANSQVQEAIDRVAAGENPEEILEEEFGLEPDYIFDLM